MPKYFWEWYESKGYIEIISIEECFKNKAFLIGCCIEYLTEKGQRITKLSDFNNIDDILHYLQTGVAWTN